MKEERRRNAIGNYESLAATGAVFTYKYGRVPHMLTEGTTRNHHRPELAKLFNNLQLFNINEKQRLRNSFVNLKQSPINQIGAKVKRSVNFKQGE